MARMVEGDDIRLKQTQLWESEQTLEEIRVLRRIALSSEGRMSVENVLGREGKGEEGVEREERRDENLGNKLE